MKTIYVRHNEYGIGVLMTEITPITVHAVDVYFATRDETINVLVSDLVKL